MILTVLLAGVAILINAIFALVPDLPATPSELDTVSTFITNMAEGAGGFLKYIYGSFFGVIVALIVALLAFENIYWVALWVYRKIPALGGK